MKRIASKWLFTILALVSLAAALPAKAQESPEGTWHFSVSGVDRGIASITFLGDGTLFGFLFLSPTASNTNQNDDTYIYGFLEIDGTWLQDPQSGKILAGFRGGPVDEDSGSSPFSASMLGKVTNGKFNLKAAGTNGRFQLKGVPETFDLPDLSGVWILRGETGTTFFFENLVLTPTGTVGLYDVTGEGPDSRINGTVLIIAKNKIAMVVSIAPLGSEEDPEAEDAVIRSTTGRYNARTDIASMSGVSTDSDDAEATSRTRLRLIRAGDLGGEE